jgi:hypothetical protein
MPYCRRCGAEIATANLLDVDPGVDRAHFALVTPGGREQLPPFEWRLFEALYQRHGRIVCVGELATAVGLAEDAVRGGVWTAPPAHMLAVPDNHAPRLRLRADRDARRA